MVTGYAWPDIPRAYTALAEWLMCLMCIIEVKRRLHGWKLAVVSAAALVVQTVFLVLTEGQNNILWILCMLTAVLLMYGFIYLCSDMNWRDTAHYCVRAFLMAEFAASLEWEIHCTLVEVTGGELSWVAAAGILAAVYGVVCLASWAIYRRYKQPEDKELMITNRELFSSVIIGIAVFSVSNLGFIASNSPFFGNGQRIGIFNARTLVDLGGAAIFYAYHIQREDLRMRQELESMKKILYNQYIQYEQSQEAMDLINYKYHDLKHHIIALRAEEDEKKRQEYLDGLEAEIRSYEAQNKTGNKVLDTLLTMKSMYCLKNDISLTSVVDGTLFGFMDTMDICSIFGNALDNAIECELKIPEKEKRLIHVSAHAQKQFLIILFENYYEGELEFNENLPRTTKGDAELHGYGLKSVRYTARKYHGEVDINTEHNWFRLKILIPM
jgi:signal transduction histidine kinase